MYTEDEVLDMLNELYDELPEYVFKNLNQGIILKSEEILSPHSDSSKPLYILGQYKRNNLGRQVVIYYGSFIKAFGNFDKEYFKDRLRDTLRHELTHHMEDQGGEWDLEYKDFLDLHDYKDSLNKK